VPPIAVRKVRRSGKIASIWALIERILPVVVEIIFITYT